MTKIIQLSDTHIVKAGSLAYGVVDTAAYLETAVETINRLKPMIGPIDALVISGDLTDFGDREEYARLRAIVEPLQIPLAVVPGNHDRREAMRAAFTDLPTMSASGRIDWCLDLPDLSVIGLDSLVEGSAHGELAAETLAFLETAIAARRGRPLLVTLHHPPFETKIGHMDKQGLRNAEALFAILARHDRPLSVSCGHVHRMISTTRDGLPVFIAPSPAHAVALDHRPDGPSHLSMDPGGFLLHHLWQHDGKASIVTEMVHSGRFDGPYPFFPE